MLTPCTVQLTGGDQMGYLDVVLDRAFDGQALRAALGQTRASTSAAEIVLELTRAVGNKGVSLRVVPGYTSVPINAYWLLMCRVTLCCIIIC